MSNTWPQLHRFLDEIQLISALHYRLRAPLYGHAHEHEDQFDLSLVIHGRGEVVIDGLAYEARPRCVFLIPPGVVHQSIDDGDVDYELIEVKFRTPTRRGRRAIPTLPVMTSLTDLAVMADAMTRLVAAHRPEPADDNWLARTRLAEVLQLLAWEGHGRGARPRELPESELERRIRIAADQIAQAFDQPLRVDALAAEAHMSRSRFALHFREIVGVTPIELAIRFRLQHARQLLSHTRMSAKEVAAACGFSSQQYLARVFTQREGCSPTAYRRHNRAAANV